MNENKGRMWIHEMLFTIESAWLENRDTRNNMRMRNICWNKIIYINKRLRKLILCWNRTDEINILLKVYSRFRRTKIKLQKKKCTYTYTHMKTRIYIICIIKFVLLKFQKWNNLKWWYLQRKEFFFSKAEENHKFEGLFVRSKPNLGELTAD